MLFLIVANGPDKGNVFELPQEEGVRQQIGRRGGEIPLDDRKASRLHAELALTEEGWRLTDLGSRNGTWLNGETLTESVLLNDGDRIQIGRTVLVFGRVTQNRIPSDSVEFEVELEDAIPSDETLAGGPLNPSAGALPEGRAKDLAAGAPPQEGADEAPDDHAFESPADPIAALKHAATALMKRQADPDRAPALRDEEQDTTPARATAATVAGLQAAGHLPPVALPRSYRWIGPAILAAVVVLCGLQAAFLWMSREHSTRMSTLMDAVDAKTAVTTEALAAEVRAIIEEERDPESKQLLHEILGTMQTRPTIDEGTRNTLGEILVAVREKPAIEFPEDNDEEVLREILSAVQAIPEEAPPAEEPDRVKALEETQQATQKMLAEILQTLKTRSQTAAAGGSGSGTPRTTGYVAASKAPGGRQAAGKTASGDPIPVVRNTSDMKQGVVFLADASATVKHHMPILMRELTRMINRLDPGQPFTVIFYRGREVVEVEPAGMKPASPQVKAAVAARLDPDAGTVAPGGKANPAEAIARAMGYKPRLVWILAASVTGDEAGQLDNTQLMDLLEKLNTDRVTRFNTTQLLNRDPQRSLRRIAESYRGGYTFLITPNAG